MTRPHVAVVGILRAAASRACHPAAARSARCRLPCHVSASSSLSRSQQRSSHHQHHSQPPPDFRIASVRLHHLSILDAPPSLSSAATEGSSADSLQLSAAEAPRVISPVVLEDATARAAWLSSIDHTETFLISKKLVPRLYELLQPAQPQQRALDPSSSSSPAGAEQQLLSASTSSSSSASVGAIVPASPTSNGLQVLHRRLDEVAAVQLQQAFSQHGARQRQQRASSTAPPRPSIPPLTEAQRRLFELAAAGEVETLRTLLPDDALMTADRQHPSHGGTLLHLAALHGRLPVMAFLLSPPLSSNPSARASNLSTPLHWAAGAGNTAAVRLLLLHGADASAVSSTWSSSSGGKGSGQTALHWAAESGMDEVVQLLTDWQPQLLVAEDERGRRPRDVAEAEAQRDVVKLLRSREEDQYVAVRLELVFSGAQIKSRDAR